MPKALVLCQALIFVLAFISCASDKSKEEPAAAAVPTVPVDTAIRDAALLLGGVVPETNSGLTSFAESSNYKSWAAAINTAWQKTQVSNLELIETWRRQNLTGDYPKTVFSPFSGPDILNAIAFFPHGTKYILFGLEPAGRVPRPENLEPKQLMLELQQLQNALGDILSRNFFQTQHMRRQVSEDSCASFSGIIMFFLTHLNMEVVAARNVSIDTNGSLIDYYNPKDYTLVPGVEFMFRPKSAKTNSASRLAATADEIRIIRYFSLDISDYGLVKKGNFEPYIRAFPDEFTTIIKSASFLMHSGIFNRTRAIVLDKSAYILQDDSGVPLRYFLNDDWTVNYYGYYEKPIRLFANHFQQTLLDNMRAKSSGPLPFSYGYDDARGKSNLIFAKKLTAPGAEIK